MKKYGNENTVLFSGVPVGEPFYENGDFKMYGFNVNDTEYPDIHHSKYGSVSVVGELPRLSIGTMYNVTAIEKFNSQYGYSYSVTNIQAEKPTDIFETQRFLEEILTYNQVSEITREYPNFIDMIMNGKEKEIDVSKLKGIGESSLQKIIDKVNANFKYSELLTEFDGLFSLATIKKLYETYTSTEMVKKKLQEDPYKFLTNIDKIGFKRADQIILKYERDGKLLGVEPFKTSKQRCKAYINYSLKENLNNGNTCMDLLKLQKQCVNEVKDCAKYFVDCIKEDDIWYDRNRKLVTFKSVYNKEKFVADKLINALRTSNKYDFNADDFAKISDSVVLTDEQLQGLQNLSDYNVSMLIGFAGSGKTATTQAIIKMLEDNKKTYVLLAPTGKAGRVLSDYTQRTASTIHRGLNYSPMQGWGYNHDNPLTCDVVIVDEFSMVDIFLFYRLLDAIDFERTKLLIIGDAAQLSSVSAGNCLHDMLDSNSIPVAELTKVFRYSEGGLMTVATDCRNRKPYLKDCANTVTQFGKNKDYTFVRSLDSNIVKNCLGLYKKLLSEGIKSDDIMVTSAYNIGDYGVVTLNNQLQKLANKNYGSDNCFKVGQTTYYLNDIVMQTINNYNSRVYDIKNDEMDSDDKIAIYNGESGRVVKILKWGIVIKFDAGYVFYNNKELQTCQLGYACTTHKSQGDSRDYVIILSPKAHTYMLTSNLIYVALTRTKNKCYQLGSEQVINRAVKKKDEERRNTMLAFLITSKYDEIALNGKNKSIKKE